MKNRKKAIASRLHLLFIPFDFLATFALALLAFIAEEGITNFSNNFLPGLIYSLTIGVITVAVFAIFKVYKIITYNFGLYEALKMAIITFIIQTLGFVAILTIPYLPEFGKIIYIKPLTILQNVCRPIFNTSRKGVRLLICCLTCQQYSIRISSVPYFCK